MCHFPFQTKIPHQLEEHCVRFLHTAATSTSAATMRSTGVFRHLMCVVAQLRVFTWSSLSSDELSSRENTLSCWVGDHHGCNSTADANILGFDTRCGCLPPKLSNTLTLSNICSYRMVHFIFAGRTPSVRLNFDGNIMYKKNKDFLLRFSFVNWPFCPLITTVVSVGRRCSTPFGSGR